MKSLKWVLVLLSICGLAAYLTFLIKPAWSRDLGQWEKINPAIKEWFSSLMQPDTVLMMSPISCCGEGDAYWADEVHVRNGKLYAVITDERPDAPLRRIHEEPGTEFEIPPEKVVGNEQKIKGNPTGHVVLFLGGNTWVKEQRKRWVLCYVQNGGV